MYVFWTGANEMSEARKSALDQLKQTTGLNVLLVTKDTVNTYILPNHPLHEAYQYLSETHKADYLRTYFMNFYGGGYSDVKRATGSWVDAYNELNDSDFYWMCGYKEIGPMGVGYLPHCDRWEELVGTGCFIFKPNTPFTKDWYASMLKVLDRNLEELRAHPATFPQDVCGSGSGYPLRWSELLSEVFHNVSFKYRNRMLRTLPICDLTWGYR